MTPEIKKKNTSWSVRQSEIFRQTQSMKTDFVMLQMLMSHQIIEFWMLRAFNLSISFKPHKNIRKLIVLFSSLCVGYGL